MTPKLNGLEQQSLLAQLGPLARGLSQTAVKGRGLHRGLQTRRQGSVSAIVEPVHHSPPGSEGLLFQSYCELAHLPP